MSPYREAADWAKPTPAERPNDMAPLTDLDKRIICISKHNGWYTPQTAGEHAAVVKLLSMRILTEGSWLCREGSLTPYGKEVYRALPRTWY